MMKLVNLTDEGQKLFRDNLKEFQKGFLGGNYNPIDGSAEFYAFMYTLATNNISATMVESRSNYGMSAAIAQAGGNPTQVWSNWSNTNEYYRYKKSGFAMDGVYLG